MDATAAPPDPVPPSGELVLLNGRQRGLRRPLLPTVTLVGQAAGCDLRLANAAEVRPLHCLLVAGPDGLHLRDWLGEPTHVNDRPVVAGPLRSGDVLTVGPFRLEVRLPPPAGPTTPAGDGALEALRIQAAAVAAQQAALTEEEVRLDERAGALEQQERQLADRLDEKRRQLLDLQGQLAGARAQLRRDRTQQAASHDEQARELGQALTEARAEHRQAQAERKRLFALRQRFIRRWKRHWAAERAALQRQADGLAERERRLGGEREAIDRARQRFNGEAELGKRQVQEAWERLAEERERWQRQRLEADAQDSTLAARAFEAAAAEKRLAERKRQAEARLRNLAAEADGVEARITSARTVLRGLERERERFAEVLAGHHLADAPAPPAAAALPPARRGPAPLEHLADTLADQRSCLAEQIQRLAEARRQGAAELAGLVAEVAAMAGLVAEREEAIARQSLALTLAEERLRAGQAEARQARLQVEAWAARLTLRESASRAEQERARADLDARRALADRREQALAELCRRWGRRRAEELERLRAELRRGDDLRRRWQEQTDAAEQQARALRQDQQALAEQALALEQSRQELFGQADSPAAAAKRLERLQRRWSARTAAAERALADRRRELAAAAAQLEERLRQVQSRTTDLVAGEARLANERAQWERSITVRPAPEPAPGPTWPAERDRYERQLAALREEIERLAHLLIEDAESIPQPPAQAA